MKNSHPAESDTVIFSLDYKSLRWIHRLNLRVIMLRRKTSQFCAPIPWVSCDALTHGTETGDFISIQSASFSEGRIYGRPRTLTQPDPIWQFRALVPICFGHNLAQIWEIKRILQLVYLEVHTLWNTDSSEQRIKPRHSHLFLKYIWESHLYPIDIGATVIL